MNDTIDMGSPLTVGAKSQIKSGWIDGIIAKSRYLYGVFVFSAVIILFISLASTAAYAVPSLEIPREVSQPSGETFQVTLHGDEWFSYSAAENGDLVVKGEDGYWYYGIAEENSLQQSSAKFSIDSKPASAQTVNDVTDLSVNIDAEFEEAYGTPVPNRSAGFRQSQNPAADFASSDPVVITGTQKVLVLLVSFTNINIVNADSSWSNKFFGNTGKTLKNYYLENSQNGFYFSPAEETYGTSNDGVVRVTLNYFHPNTGEDTNQKNINIVINAINAADAFVDFSSFDTNSDGTVSNSELHILTVVAGNDASCGDSSPTIWPHSWETEANQVKDGKIISGEYTQIADKQSGHMTTVGVVAHELAHDLGLPDLYDYDDSSDGVGIYSLMARGSWGTSSSDMYDGATPTHMDAWSKIQLGFATPVIAATGSYSMKSVANGGYSVLKITTSDPNQYFLVENRQPTGFDAGLAYYDIYTGGIAIFHVDDSVSGNDDEYHKLVDLEEANEVAYGGCQLDDNNYMDLPYNNLFRAGINTLFSYNTMPANALYSGALTNTSIGVPGSSSGSMTVNINIFDDFIVEYGVLLRYLGPGGAVSIPAGITTIDYEAFYGCSDITSIIVPDSVVSIEVYAFSNCTSLTSITLTNNITNIGAFAFYGCTSLSSITIPTGISTIESGTFYSCTSLNNVRIPDNVTAIDDYAFADCPELGIIKIPNSVVYMNEDVFFECPIVKIYGYNGSYVQAYAISHSIPFALFGISSDYPIQDDIIYVKIPLFGFYRKVSLPLSFSSYDDTLNYSRLEWSSDNTKVLIDQNGMIRNIKTGARSADITVKLYDQNNNLVSTDTVKVIFYKYKWQLKKLKSQSVVSDNYAQRNMSAEEYEAYEAQESVNPDNSNDLMQSVFNFINNVVSFLQKSLMFR